MNRLLATIQADFRLQFRNGFYYAAGFVVVVLIAIARQLPEDTVRFLMPVLLAENLTINAFYFMGGLVLLEKGEGTLEAQVVTPLRTWEYLASKMVTLTFLSLVESLLIVGLSVGLDVGWFAVILGVALLAAIFVFFGFIAVARYDSINEYLFPSFLYTALLSIPLLVYFGLWDGWLLYLHPLQAPLELMKASFQRAEAWRLVYGVLYSLAWIAVVYSVSQRWFYRFVIRKEGVR